MSNVTTLVLAGGSYPSNSRKKNLLVEDPEFLTLRRARIKPSRSWQDLCRLGPRILTVLCIGFAGCSPTPSERATLYASVDRDVAEPILAHLPDPPRVAYDAEANKTAGVVNRLLAERARPQADVFWSGEIARTIELANAGVLAATRVAPALGHTEWDDPQGRWFALAGRVRVLVVRSTLAETPSSLSAFTDPQWRGRSALANPRFGTTATHFAALLSIWGEARFRDWLHALRANQVAILAGNAQVRDAVADGSFDFGLTDSDDVVGGLQQRLPLRLVVPDQQAEAEGTLMIPSTVARIAGRTNAALGEKLLAQLLAPYVERSLAVSRAAQIPLRHALPPPKHLPKLQDLKLARVDFQDVSRQLPRMMRIVDEEWPP